MDNIDDLRLSGILIRWYAINKRDLPWRDTADAYKIWLSEIILQQTRVDQGLAYFIKFINRFPAVGDLASADEDEVLKLWQGLGYYSRARNLHAAAKTVVEKYGGVFPTAYKDVLSLKGVGEYTAAAIMSFAYNSPYAVVDGNVYRVLARIFGISAPIDSTKGKKIFAQLAQSLLDVDNAGIHNQAIMEFGALQCVPVSPDCLHCTASSMCSAYASGSVGGLPVKQGKVKVRQRYFNYFDIRTSDGMMYIAKRTRKDIWHGLYEFPLIETEEALPYEELRLTSELESLLGQGVQANVRLVARYKHVLSHQIINAVFYRVDLACDAYCRLPYMVVKESEIDGYAVSRLVERYLEDAEGR